MDDTKEISIINFLESTQDKKNQLTRRPIDKDTKEWSPDLAIALPVDGSGIPVLKRGLIGMVFH